MEFQPGRKTFDHLMELSFLLEEVLSREVEVVTAESLSPHIVKEAEYVSIAA